MTQFHLCLETSGGVLLAVDTVVQRRNGPRRLRDSDDDNDDDDDDESLYSYEARVVCNFVDV